MNESVKNLIDAIASGDATQTESAFQAAMAEKISAKLEDMRVSVAQSMFTPVQEEVEQIDEAVSVKKQDYSWGKMITVHHGADTSYPLHPEHQEKIKNLKDGEHTSFTDETNRKVTAHREGEHVHLTSKGTSRKTTVAHSHFNESVNKSDIPAYLRKKTGDKLTTQDLDKERTQNRSHPETIKKINGTDVKEAMRPGFDWEAAAKRNKEMKDKGYERGDAPYTWKKIKPKPDTEKEKVKEDIDFDKIRADAADHLKKSIDKQSDDRIAALKNPKKPESFLAKVGHKQINMVKGAWHGLTKESKDDVPFDGPYSKPTDTVTDKSGAKHTPMSRARHLARMAALQQQKKAKK